MNLKLSYVFLALALASGIQVYCEFVARLHPHTIDMFVWKHAPLVGGVDIRTLSPESPEAASFAHRENSLWARRFASLEWAKSWLFSKPVSDVNQIYARIGTWTAAWFLGYAALVYVFRDRMLFLFAGALSIYWAYLPDVLGGAGTRIYPWDLPAMWFLTAGVVAYFKFKPVLPAVILIGLPFKDTTSTLLLLPLFDLIASRFKDRNSIKLSVACLAAIVLGNFWVWVELGQRLPGAVELVGWCSPENTNVVRFFYNLNFLFEKEINSALFICSGFFVVSLVLGLVNFKNSLKYLFLLGALSAGLMLAGVIHEYRIWLETVPVSCVLISLYERRELV